MHGFYNKILKIDLSEQQFQIEEIEERVYETYLGGKGLASYLLFTLNPEGVDPLAQENHLIFATGSLTGGLTWGSSRYGVFTKSPLTGLYAESYSGGKVPEAISATGFDAIVIKGCADKLSLLDITPEGVTFHERSDLKGKNTFDTEEEIKHSFFSKKVRSWKQGSVVVGPAAENGIAYSIIKNDGWRCAGRAGTGTVMGSKNLKAIVFQGNCKRKPFDKKQLMALSKELSKESKDHPVVNAYKSMGTSQMVKIMNTAKAFPTEYWKKGVSPHWEKISADALHTQCDVKPHACAKCFLSCGRMTKVLEGRHNGLVLEGPEYETIYVFGGLCMIDSIEEIAWLNSLCDSLGMDTITTGNLCAFAMEAFKLGKSDYEIMPGDADGIGKLIELIANRVGVGEILSQGIIPAAREWGMEDKAVHVKGMEPAGYDPRVLKGMALGYATSDRGACHLRSTFYKPELAGMIKPDEIEGKAEMFVDFEDRLTLFDTQILCRFFRDIYPWELLETLVHGATGIDGSKTNLKKIALTISSKIREFNLREGMTDEHEKIPEALYKKLKDSGISITKEDFEKMLQDYYALRGWKTV